jgi:hypothetical protein
MKSSVRQHLRFEGRPLGMCDVRAARKLLVAPVGATNPVRDGIAVMKPLTAAAQFASLVTVKRSDFIWCWGDVCSV